MAPMETSVSLERYAAIRAELEAGRLRDDVLTRSGLSADDWTAAQEAWLDRMGDELSLGRFELANRYARAFVDAQHALEKAKAIAPPPAVEPPALAPAVIAPAPAPVEAVPSFLIPDTPPPAPLPKVVRAPAALSGTAVGLILPKGDSLPFKQSADSAPLPPPSALPRVVRPPAALAGTSMSLVLPKGPVLPFAADAPESAPGESAAEDTSVATAALSPAAIAAAAAAAPLPFQAGPPVSRGEVEPARSSHDGAAGGPKPPPVGGMTGELPADLIARIAASMPFSKTTGQSGTTPAPAEGEAATLDDADLIDEVDDATAPIAPLTTVKVALASSVSSAGPPALTLEQYAALCAELSAYPQQQEAVFQRYGLAAPEDRAAVGGKWQDRLREDPGESQRWQALYRHYQGRFTAAKERG